MLVIDYSAIMMEIRSDLADRVENLRCMKCIARTSNNRT